MTDRITHAEYQRAESELRTEQERIGFIVHAVVYALVNALSITINLVYVPAVIWFFYPLIGWGSGLLMHFLFSMVWVQKRDRKRTGKGQAPGWPDPCYGARPRCSATSVVIQ